MRAEFAPLGAGAAVWGERDPSQSGGVCRSTQPADDAARYSLSTGSPRPCLRIFS